MAKRRNEQNISRNWYLFNINVIGDNNGSK